MNKKSKSLTKRIITFFMTATMILETISIPSVEASPTEFRWLGRDGSAHVDTGFGNGTEGDWWVLTDKNDLGTSQLILSGKTDPFTSGDYISDEDIKKSGGISGTATLGPGYDYPYVYIGFNIVGLNNETNKPIVTDATDWGGISIAYESDTDIKIELGMGDKDKDVVEYDCPQVILRSTGGECEVKSFAWKNFTQGGWGREVPIDDIVTSLAVIRIKIEGLPGKKCNFKIYGIGSKDADLSEANLPAKYNVTFDTNGGSAVVAQSVESGQKATKPEAPTRDGFDFVGWYTDSALTTPFDFNTAITKDTTIYAKWSENGTVIPALAAKGTKLVDEKGGANYVILSVGKTDTSDSSKNVMPTVEYKGTTNKKAKKINVPDTVTIGGVTYNVESIGTGAFKKNKKITSVTIGANVKKIKKNAFAGCTSLKTVNCKSTVLANIGANAFKGDRKLTKIILKTTMLKKSKVGLNAIKGTSKKLKIIAPKKVKKLYQKIFKVKGNKKIKVK